MVLFQCTQKLFLLGSIFKGQQQREGRLLRGDTHTVRSPLVTLQCAVCKDTVLQRDALSPLVPILPYRLVENPLLNCNRAHTPRVEGARRRRCDEGFSWERRTGLNWRRRRRRHFFHGRDVDTGKRTTSGTSERFGFLDSDFMELVTTIAQKRLCYGE